MTEELKEAGLIAGTQQIENPYEEDYGDLLPNVDYRTQKRLAGA